MAIVHNIVEKPLSNWRCCKTLHCVRNYNVIYFIGTEDFIILYACIFCKFSFYSVQRFKNWRNKQGVMETLQAFLSWSINYATLGGLGFFWASLEVVFCWIVLYKRKEKVKWKSCYNLCYFVDSIKCKIECFTLNNIQGDSYIQQTREFTNTFVCTFDQGTVICLAYQKYKTLVLNLFFGSNFLVTIFEGL